MRKRIVSFSLAVLILLAVLCACGKPNDTDGTSDEIDCTYSKLADNPTEEYIIECLNRVKGVGYIAAATEDHDPNKLLNKVHGYYSAVFFSADVLGRYKYYTDWTLINAGTKAGGCIEAYRTHDDALARNKKLSEHYSSGYHTVLGTLVIRTSNNLTESQKDELEAAIIFALTDDTPATTPSTTTATETPTTETETETTKAEETTVAETKAETTNNKPTKPDSGSGNNSSSNKPSSGSSSSSSSSNKPSSGSSSNSSSSNKPSSGSSSNSSSSNKPSSGSSSSSSSSNKPSSGSSSSSSSSNKPSSGSSSSSSGSNKPSSGSSGSNSSGGSSSGGSSGGSRLVWIPTNGGTKYHSKSSCSNMKDPVQVTLDEALSMGFERCKRCKP